MTEFELLEKRVKELEAKLNFFVFPDRYQFQRTVAHTGQKLGFLGATPVAQQTFTGATLGMTTPGGATVQENSAFGGTIGTTKYTIHGLVDVLKIFGFIAK